MCRLAQKHTQGAVMLEAGGSGGSLHDLSFED